MGLKGQGGGAWSSNRNARQIREICRAFYINQQTLGSDQPIYYNSGQ